MKLFLILALSLLQLSARAEQTARAEQITDQASQNFSVRWWNIGGTNFWSGVNTPYWTPCYSQSESAFESTALKQIGQNILKAAQASDSPDVMMFGEYIPGLLAAKTLTQIEKIYPFQFDFQYNSLGRPYEIFVLSKQAPSSTVYKENALEWAKQNIEAQSPDHHLLYLRSYQRLTFEVGSQQINLVPLHAVQPWADMENDGSPGVIARLGRYFEIGLDMVFSNLNPSAVQGNIFQGILKSDQNWNKAQTTWMVMGDFNLPDELLEVAPRAFRNFKGDMDEVSLEHGDLQ